jgi:hypothetical protein
MSADVRNNQLAIDFEPEGVLATPTGLALDNTIKKCYNSPHEGRIVSSLL